MNSYLPFTLFNELRDINRGFDRQASDGERAAQWQPAVDICENEGGFLLVMDVPGIAPDAVDITVHNGVLTVQGERKTDAQTTKNSIKNAGRVSLYDASACLKALKLTKLPPKSNTACWP
jgi:HSP20 family protein